MNNPPQGDPRTDAELISSVRSGDPAAFGQLYARHADAVRMVAGYYTSDAATADDLTSDAFERMLVMLQSGRGPNVSFRAYIYTIVRRLAFEQADRGRRTQLTDDFAPFDTAGPIVDPATGTFEQRLVADAFSGLPERWQAALWYLEVEGMRPAEVGVLLGLTANGVSALAYRAREALRSAYLQAHVSSNGIRRRCVEHRGRLGAWVAGSLSAREAGKVAAHVDDCDECTAIVAELRDASHGLRAVLAPLILGGAAAGALGAASSPSMSAAAATTSVTPAVLPRPPRDGSTMTVVAAVSGAAAALVGAVALGILASPPTSGTLADPASPDATSSAPAAPSPSRTPRPTPPSSPDATPGPVDPGDTEHDPGSTPRPTPAPHLALAFADVGDLVRGRDGMVGVSVSASASTAAPTVVLDLPPGVAYDPTRRMLLPAGWTCAPQPGGDVACVGPALRVVPTSLVVPVSVSDDASTAMTATATLRAPGAASVTATSTSSVVAHGLGTRFVADGSYSTALAGSSFLTCDTTAPGCVEASSFAGPPSAWNNEDWTLVLRQRGEHSPSSATVTYPAGSAVAFAGLYWSGPTPPGLDDAALGTIDLVSPAGGTSAVTASRVVRGTAIGTDRFQAFADVTSIVAEGGAGVWTAQDPVLGTGSIATPGSSINPGAHAGWALVVVYADPTASSRRVTVVDGFETVANDTLSLGLAAGTPGPLQVGMVVWEGDANNPGDSVSLDGLPLARVGVPGTTNVVRSRADGADVVNTFGVDVGWFEPHHVGAGRSRLDVTSDGDTVIVGAVVTVVPHAT